MASPATSIDYPICLRLQGKRVLLVGAGNIAEGRALQLLDTGARLRMIAPAATWSSSGERPPRRGTLAYTG